MNSTIASSTNAAMQNHIGPAIGGTSDAEHRRLRVQRPPVVHRHVDERRVRHAEERHAGGELVRSGTAEAAQQQIGNRTSASSSSAEV